MSDAKRWKTKIQLMFCAALLLTGCGPAPEQAAEEIENVTEVAVDSSTSEPEGKPILVHLRLAFTDEINTQSTNTQRQLRTTLYLQQQALQYGKGQDLSFSLQESPVKVMGSLQAQGSVKFSQDDLSQDEQYQMAQYWPALTENPAGRWRIVEPEPSNIGDGLQFKLELTTPVSGTKHAKISSKGQTIDTEVQQSKPFSCDTANDQDQCSLEFTFDAVPTVAKNDFGASLLESAKTLYQYQGKKAPDGGLVMFGSVAPIYGAVTSYEGDRLVIRFSQQFTENLDGAVISQKLQVVMWTSAPDESWQPDDLPPLTTTAASE
ncbi:MAG: hypothetical protein ACK4NN_11840 [Rheinheimera sp.]